MKQEWNDNTQALSILGILRDAQFCLERMIEYRHTFELTDEEKEEVERLRVFLSRKQGVFENRYPQEKTQGIIIDNIGSANI